MIFRFYGGKVCWGFAFFMSSEKDRVEGGVSIEWMGSVRGEVSVEEIGSVREEVGLG